MSLYTKIKCLCLVAVLMLPYSLYAQPKASRATTVAPHTVKKARTINYGKNCSFRQHWYEVVLADKLMADSVNRQIRRIFDKHYYTPGNDYCAEPKAFTYSCDVVFFNANFLSLDVNLNTFFEGMQHSYNNFNTINFNLLTGQRLHFSALIRPDKKQELEDLMRTRLAMHYGCTVSQLPPGTEEQIADVDFRYATTGDIILMFHDTVYGAPVDQPWTVSELRTYMLPGLFY